jgi:YbbR domain-containing protein
VVLIAGQPSHATPAGFYLSGITFDPILVVISGRADALLKVTSVTLPAADLSGRTTAFTVTVTIPYPAGVTGSRDTVRVTYLILPNPTQPSPTPSP